MIIIKTYEILKKYLNDKNQDSTFSPALLCNLPNEERFAIEYEIAMYCRKGCQQYFKYIPYFQIIKIENFMTSDILDSFSPEIKMEASANLFFKNKSSSYFKFFVSAALENALAFNILVNLSMDERLLSEEQNKIKAIVQEIYNQKKSDINYKMIMDLKFPDNYEKPKTK